MNTLKQRCLLPVMAVLMVGALALPIGAGGSVAHAQGNSDESPPSGFVCMARTGTGLEGASHTTRVMVPNAEEAKLTGRGFVRSSCGEAVSWMRTTGPSMCGLADLNDPAFISQFMNMHGLTPAEICELAAQLPTGP